MPYPVVADADGMAASEVRYESKKEVFRPEQVAAAMLGECKKIAEMGLENQRVTDVVIACPQYWTEVERRAMLDAAGIAGLNCLRLMNETTAVVVILSRVP